MEYNKKIDLTKKVMVGLGKYLETHSATGDSGTRADKAVELKRLQVVQCFSEAFAEDETALLGAVYDRMLSAVATKLDRDVNVAGHDHENVIWGLGDTGTVEFLDDVSSLLPNTDTDDLIGVRFEVQLGWTVSVPSVEWAGTEDE